MTDRLASADASGGTRIRPSLLLLGLSLGLSLGFGLLIQAAGAQAASPATPGTQAAQMVQAGEPIVIGHSHTIESKLLGET
ncbi:MAG: hypothetical protein AAGG01_19570, partial [Planctomycetota bacterium]